MKADNIQEGEVLVLPPYTYFDMSCCNCGFTHKVFLLAPNADNVMLVFFQKETDSEKECEI